MSEIVEVKKSRKVWRKEVKKLRRKKIRQKLAKERDDKLQKEEEEKLKNPTYLTWLSEQNALKLMREEREEIEQAENHEKWLRAELIAQMDFIKLKKKLEDIEKKKNLIRMKIKEEFEQEQRRLEEVKAQAVRLAAEKIEKFQILQRQIEFYIHEGGDVPEELTTNAESNPGKPLCQFFIKTGSCRFGDRCIRNHCRPGLTKLLLIPNFFTHIQLDQNKTTEYGGDSLLEFDDSDLQKSFLDFFEDISVEMESFGKLEQLFVCRNFEPHLRGNVYVQYESQRDALKAYQKIQGRYYGGKRLNVEFSSIVSWPATICGTCTNCLSVAKKCPKGRSCNYLHLFKNPNNKYSVINRSNVTQSLRDPYVRRELGSTTTTTVIAPSTEIVNRSWNDDDDDTNKVKKRNWRWSESPEQALKRRRSKSKSKSTKKSKKEKRRRSRSSSRRKIKSSRSDSRSRERDRHHDEEKLKKRKRKHKKSDK